MQNNCVSCHQIKPAVWSDFCAGYGNINLCADCFEKIYPEQYNFILPKLIICSSCGNKFLPKFQWQQKCFLCFQKGKRSVICGQTKI